jgi:triacylglycerol lipase
MESSPDGESLRDALRALARAPFTPETMTTIMGLVRGRHERRGYTAPRIERDIAYGADPRQRLDVHCFEGAANQPVLVWVPGGGFVSGTKWQPGTPHQDNVGAWAWRHGALAVVIDYRLAPQHAWPTAARDVASAIEWVRRNIAAYGGSPERIVLAGGSAGAAHVASFMAGQGDGDPQGVAAVAVVSGIYAPALMAEAPHRDLVRTYYGTDEDALRMRSSVAGLAAWPGPLLVTVTEFDPPGFQEQALLLASERLRVQRALPYAAVVPGHMHASDVFSLGIDDSALDLMLRQLLARIRG